MTPIILLIACILMLYAAKIDSSSFTSKRHINCKSIIINIGVLGTFIGIVLGLLDFDTSNIVDSVPQLLEGLKLAFLTSIAGLALSIFLSVKQASFLSKNGVPVISEKDKKLEATNQTLVANQTLATIKQQGEQCLTETKQTNQILREILNHLKHPVSLTKLDATGEELPKEATQWVAIQDNNTAYIWDNKSHANKYKPADIQAYIKTINEAKLAGYSDWTLPTIETLENLAYEKRFFPNIQLSSWYFSSTPAKNKQLLCFNFETRHQALGQSGYILLMRG